MVYQRIYDLLVEKQNQQIDEGVLSRFAAGFRKRNERGYIPESPVGHAIKTGKIGDVPGRWDKAEALPQHSLRNNRLNLQRSLRDKIERTNKGKSVSRLTTFGRIQRGLANAFRFKNKRSGLGQSNYPTEDLA